VIDDRHFTPNREEIRSQGASSDVPPAHVPAARPGPAEHDPNSFVLAVRLQPDGPTVTVRVTKETLLSYVKAEAFLLLGLPLAEMPQFVLELGGRYPLDESKTVGQERLWDLAFIHLGRSAEVGPDQRLGGP